MQKVSHRQIFMLTLPGLVLLAAFLIIGGVEALLMDVPTAQASTLNISESTQENDDCIRKEPSFGSAVVVSSREVECGNVTSFGGNVVIHGTVKGDVVAFKSDVEIDGSLDGNVTVYGGNLIFLNAANINGDSHVCGGHWQKGAETQLHGSVSNDCTEGVWNLLGNDAGINYRFWWTLTWVTIGIVLTMFLPEHVVLVRTTICSKMSRSLAVGLLSILLAPVILVVLIALIISIPLALLIGAGLLAGWSLGTVAVGWIVGEHIVQKIAPQQNTRLTQVVVGMIVVALAESLPYLGLFFSAAAGIIGLGAVLLSRFGTRLYSQPKKPLPL